MISARGTPYRQSECGQALAEFALALPVFCALLFGSIEMGLRYKTHAAYQEATQEAVRVGAAVGASDQDMLDELKIMLAAENLKNIQSVTIYDATASDGFAVPIRTTPSFDNAHTTYVYSATVPAAGGGSGAFVCSVAGTPPPCTNESYWAPATRNATIGQLDRIGINVTYTYKSLTGVFRPLTIDQRTAVQLEPNSYGS